MTNPTKTQIGEWLKNAREAARDRAEPDKKADFAQAGVAGRLGVRERAVRMWEKGRTSPPAHQFFEMAWLYHAQDALVNQIAEWTASDRQSKAAPDDTPGAADSHSTPHVPMTPEEIAAFTKKVIADAERESAKKAGRGKGRRASGGGR